MPTLLAWLLATALLVAIVIAFGVLLRLATGTPPGSEPPSILPGLVRGMRSWPIGPLGAVARPGVHATRASGDRDELVRHAEIEEALRGAEDNLAEAEADASWPAQPISAAHVGQKRQRPRER